MKRRSKKRWESEEVGARSGGRVKRWESEEEGE